MNEILIQYYRLTWGELILGSLRAGQKLLELERDLFTLEPPPAGENS